MTSSPAQEGGLAEGDTITSFNGQTVASPSALTNLLLPFHPGDKVTIGWTDSSGSVAHRLGDPVFRAASVGQAARRARQRAGAPSTSDRQVAWPVFPQVRQPDVDHVPARPPVRHTGLYPEVAALP